MKYFKCLHICLIILFPLQIFGQNYVVDFQTKLINDQVKISISALDGFKYEVIPFDSKTYTLVKLYPVQFKEETKESFITPLKKLPFKIQTLELMDQSLLLTFKGILHKQLQVSLNESVNKLEIIVSPKLVTQNIIKIPSKTAWEYYQSAILLEKENQNLAAIADIRKALRLKPNYAEAYFLAGKIRFERGEWKMAKINFAQAQRYNRNIGDLKPYLVEIEKKLYPVQLVQKKVVQSEPEEIVGDSSEVDSDIIPEEIDLDSSFVANSPVSTIGSLPIFNFKKSDPDSVFNRPIEYPMQMKSQSYFQMAFLCFIVLVILVWGVLLWKKRIYFKKEKSKFDFSKMIQQIQKQTDTLGKDMPEMKTKPPIQKVEKIKMKNEINHEIQNPKIKRTPLDSFIEHNRQNSKIDFDFNSSIEKEKQPKDEKVLHLASLGYSVEEIAKQLQVGKGEVQLILNFRGKEIPMSAPRVRIEMD